MSGFRPETHVAQQSRRDKLRVPQNPPPDPHHHPAQFRSCGSLYDPPQPPSMFTPGMLDLAAAAEASLLNPSTSGFHDAAGGIGWKGDWSLSCMGGGGGAPIQTPLIPSHLYHLKHGLSGYHDISGELPSHDGEKQYGDLHFSSSQFYHNPLQDVVTSPSSTVGAVPPCPWVDGGSELLLLPSYGNPANSPVWMNRGTQQWYGEGDLARIKGEGDRFGAVASGGGSTQGLSLSLSSNPLPELPAGPFEERFRREDLTGDAGFSCSYPKYPVSSVQGTMGSAEEPRGGAGPLGPFTGYAAILKSSKFLKPAQQLLDEFCSVVTCSKLSKHCDKSDAVVGDRGSDGKGGNSVVSSSSAAYNGSSEAGGDGRGCQIHRPEFQQKKVKLLYMQEEVCKRYKQYHQQMQMVVSSFETVAGLSSATPYASLALKAVSKHFRFLKNAISDQLRHVSKLLGDELMSSPGSSKGETMTTATPRLKYIDQSIRKNKAAENSLSFFDHSQPVWRPQRGLPERAVAVLRAWLFDHFLHPYPTDTDKHMLATQTGLSRNQVSNWFINARVRLWKPMVEEIHMLETKGASGMDLNSSSRNHGNPVIDDLGQHSSDQLSEAQSNRPMDCSPMDPMLDEESSRAMEQWHREKRSRMEACGIPEGMDGSLMSFAAYQSGMDIGGLGAVSLTLGLRHNDGAQQQQQMRRHFGSHMVQDFVG